MRTDEQSDIRTTPLTRPEPKVDKKEPWGDDKLNRRQAADALTNLVKAQRGPFVVSLDGDWGTGKTFFLERWRQQLVNDGLRVIYFNAWHDDFFEDPLVPMLARIMKTTDDRGIRKRMSESMKSLAYRNARSLTSKFMGVELPEFGDDILEAFECQEESRKRLKEELDKIVTAASRRPFVFIVDELDRCRPDFAIATLERTKHMLDIPGLVFVYGINRRELRKSIASLYGNIDTDVYVRRFFDMDFNLPAVSSYNYCSYLAEQYGIPANIKAVQSDEVEASINAVPDILSTIAGLSLRDIEQCVRIAALVAINLARGKIGFDYAMVMTIIVIRLMNNDLYRRFARGEHVAGKMIDFLAERATRSPLGDLLWLVHVQASLYAMCDEDVPSRGTTAHDELARLQKEVAAGGDITKPVLLAETNTDMDTEELSIMMNSLKHWRSTRTWGYESHELAIKWRPHLVALLELVPGT